MNSPDTLLPASTVLNIFGNISQMTLWRWVRDDEMGFPKPIKIKRRNYFKAREIENYRNSLTSHDEVSA